MAVANERVANLSSEVSTLNGTVESQAALIGGLNGTVESQAALIGELNGTVESQAALIGELSATVNNQSATINDQADAIDKLIATVNELNNKINDLMETIDELNKTSKRIATEIIYEDMETVAVDTATDGRIGEYFEVVLKDSTGKILAGKPVQIGFNGKVYNRTTDENGSCKLQINLAKAGTYTFSVCFLGDYEYNGTFVVAKITVTAQKVSLTVPNKSYKASAKTKTLTATFKSASGNLVKGKKVSFTVNGKTYTATTNDKGVATVNVSLSKKGTYSFTAKFAGDNTYAAIAQNAKLTIS